MKHLNKLVPVFFTAMLGMTAMTSCEGGDLFSIDSPDWISEKADSIAASKVTEEVTLEGMMEDVYTIGNTDYTSGWWSSFSKYYVVPDGQTWYAQFNLNINPSDNTYYKNFALVVTTDADRSGDGYLEYGAIRFDATNDSTSYNSLWGTNLYFKYAESNLLLAPESNADANVQKLGGKVTLMVDRSDPNSFTISISNSSVTKTYKQPYAMGNLNADVTNTNMRFFLVPEGSYMEFLSTNIEPIGGCTSALDKQPVSLTLSNVPDVVTQGATLEEAVAGITGVVEFEEGVTLDVTAEDLIFSAIPDIESLGTKTLIAIYNKTYKGENADVPVMASATFNVMTEIASIEVVAQPSSYALPRRVNGVDIARGPFAFDATGVEVMATYTNGDVASVDNSKLTFSTVADEAGTQAITVTTENGVTTTFDLNVTIDVVETTIVNATMTPSVVGLEDDTTGWWSAFSDDQRVPAGQTLKFNFTNYTSGANNWNNYLVILRNAALAEYAVLRADNYGWGNGYAAATVGCDSGEWSVWLAAMYGANVTVYITNPGDGTVDVNSIVKGNNGVTYNQYYLGINTVDPEDLFVAFTVEGGHLVAE
jgi:hypothetical protein